VFNAGSLTFEEFVMHETVPLTEIHEAVLRFLAGRDDVVVFGAQAVNAYVREPRMTQDVDLLSIRAAALAVELRDRLRTAFHIAVRIREVGEGRGYRVFQVRKAGNRHLVDIRPVATLPPANRIADVLVIAPEDLIASKVIALHLRRGQPKSGTDWRDVAMLLLTFPQLKHATGPVTDRLRSAGADREVLRTWSDLVASDIREEDEDQEFWAPE